MVVLGITAEGYKDILSITVGANETSKFWLGMLNDLKNRGVQDNSEDNHRGMMIDTMSFPRVFFLP